MDRHWDESTKVFVLQVQIPLEANILLKLIYCSPHNNTKMTTLPTLCNYGKTQIGKSELTCGCKSWNNEVVLRINFFIFIRFILS